MNSEPNNGTLTLLAKILSVILHPILMPLWVMQVLMSCGLLLPYTTPQARIYFTLVIVLNTVVVPAICTLLFNRVRFWRENRNADFRQRILPMAVMMICYMACVLMIKDIAFAYPVKKMLTAGIGCLLFGFIVSFFWKVSLHMIAQGAVVAFLGIILLSGAENMLPALAASIALAALLASARLYLGAHDVKQVAAGFAGGLIITIMTIYLI